MDENFNPINPGVENTESSTDIGAEKATAFTPGETDATVQKAPESFNTNGSYYTPPTTPSFGQEPFNPYNQPPYNQQPIPQPSNKEKKKNFGKTVFVVLVCACIIFASVSIGFLSMNDGIFGNSSAATTNESGVTHEGAIPTVEDSPESYSQYSGEGVMTPEQVYQTVKDINVGILVYSQSKAVGEGSGIVVGTDKAGKYTYILTAAHVISDSNVSVQVQFSDGTEHDAEIVGVDEKTDVGVVKIEATGFKAATFGNTDKLMVGQTVYAIGNPGGTEFFGSFTGGIISAIDRPVPTTNSSYDLPCIQHTAAINPGNSGGALVNQYGQVIGLNSSKISSTDYEGMGFAVPSNTVLEIYNEIVKYGYVTNRPMLGILYFPVSSDYTYSAVAWKNNLPYGSVVISSINPSSDLANHDIEIGDIITGVNGKDLTTTDILLEEIEKAKVDDKIKLSICKLNNNGSINSTIEIEVVLVEDKGNNTVKQQQPTEAADPFYEYFENF